VATEVPFRGAIFDVRRDTVDLGAGGVVVRDYIEHPGAVVVVALRVIDGVDHVLLVRQYRHPAGAHLWELPAGLLDVAGEDPRDAAARELHEETDLAAGRWHVLVDYVASPGAFPEAVRVFLARDLTEVAEHEQHARSGEELTLKPMWFSLDDAHDAALSGGVNNSAALIGILSAHASRARGWETLRPEDSPWPQRALRS
jgi:ADP-ribose pyrophosphatase